LDEWENNRLEAIKSLEDNRIKIQQLEAELQRLRDNQPSLESEVYHAQFIINRQPCIAQILKTGLERFSTKESILTRQPELERHMSALVEETLGFDAFDGTTWSCGTKRPNPQSNPSQPPKRTRTNEPCPHMQEQMGHWKL